MSSPVDVAAALKLIAMPNRRTPSLRHVAPRASFRERYDELETRRAELVARLTSLGETARNASRLQARAQAAQRHVPQSKLAQRLAVLQAAAWLIDVLEKLSTMT